MFGEALLLKVELTRYCFSMRYGRQTKSRSATQLNMSDSVSPSNFSFENLLMDSITDGYFGGLLI